MRLTTIILIMAIMQVSASTFAQRITLSEKNATLNQVFDRISDQSGYYFIFTSDLLKGTKPVTISVKNTELDKVLEQIFAGQPLSFSIEDKTVVVKAKQKRFFENVLDNIRAIDVRGRVLDEKGEPLVGATVAVKGKNRSVKTDQNGAFFLEDVGEGDKLVISFIGYQNREVDAASDMGSLTMVVADAELEEVKVVSTGYQTLPKERATGSFTTIDEKTLNRNVGVNILDRLEGVSSGVIFNRGLGGTNNSKISIHGRSTLFSNPEPLVVLDGFPYDGTIDQINPADIESINLLKDAAAASIWGVRSGNGVIVITSKRGTKNKKLSLGVTSTITIADKPDLYYTPQMSSSEFIELEQFLFNKGFYNSQLNQRYLPVSPAVEIFNQRKLSKISSADSATKINELKTFDVRKDLLDHVYRPKVHQQYGLNLSGGTLNHKYYFSSGYDKSLENKVSDNSDRLTLNASNSFSLLNDKLELSADINFTSSNIRLSSDIYTPFTPYDRLIDERGNHLPVAISTTFRNSYLDTVGNGKLLDWHYRPLDELQSNSNVRLNQYRIKGGLSFNILNGLNFLTNYQFINEVTTGERNSDVNSFFTRDLINRYTSIVGNTINRVIPLGDYFSQQRGNLTSKVVRMQLNLNRTFAGNHEINGIIGYEGSDVKSQTGSQPHFGYDSETMRDVNGTINPTNDYKLYYGTGTSRILTSGSLYGNTNINQSFFSNLSYTFKNRYILSGSARRDESNLFGVETNQKGVPLWSAGFAWNIHKENFFKIDWLSYLKLRTTYGVNGNFDRSTSAYLAAINLGIQNEWGENYSQITNPANASLKWEKVKTSNIGLDFSNKTGRILGSFDIYKKVSDDLIGNSPISFQSGVVQYRGNGASLQTTGFDLNLTSKNLVNEFKWETTLLLNFNKDRVTSYKIKQSANSLVVSGNYDNPLEGYPYHSIFSYPSAGLSANGKVQGYLDGAATTDLGKIANVFDPNLLRYHGTSSPKYFGNILNRFGFKDFEFSFNVSYKLDYYFRRGNIFSGNNFRSAGNPTFKLSDYSRRWLKAGDEQTTNVPVLAYPSNSLQNTFYQFSSDHIERGDHIRLQDLRLAYNFNSKVLTMISIKKATVFFYSKNIGILWRENKHKIDPDFGTTTIPQPFSCSFGLNLSL